MAYCRNCGSEIAEGVKFCTNCGMAVEKIANHYSASNNARFEHESASSDMERDYNYNSEYANMQNIRQESRMRRPVEKGQSTFEKFSRFFGIILLLFAIVDFVTDPPLFTIILSLVIIICAIFCLSQKYKLKGFSIAAIILAVVCLSAGITQGVKLGFLNTPMDNEYVSAGHDEETNEETPRIQIETNNDSASADSTVSSGKETPETVRETKQTQNVDGVDPDLKEFLDMYEQFMDEYIAFMKKYMEDPGNAVSMLNDYMSFLDMYEEFAEVANELDQDEMSVADAKYYIDAMNRINQKMLELY